MAIAFDAVTYGGGLVASPLTFSHTTSGSDRFLWVAAIQVGLVDTVSGITYGGVAMTKATYEPSDAGFNYYSFSLWYLANPSSGANNVVITTTAGNVTGFAVSYTGVQGGYDNSTHGNSAATPLNLSGVTVANNAWAIMVATDGGGAISAGTNMTQRINNGFIVGDSNAAITPAGSYTLGVTWVGGGGGGGVWGSMSPTAAAAATGSTLLMMGV